MLKIRVYTLTGCTSCANAKKLLNAKGVQYENIEIKEHTAIFDKIKEAYNIKGVPQIFMANENGEVVHHILGCDTLKVLNDNGKLNSILDEYGLKHT